MSLFICFSIGIFAYSTGNSQLRSIMKKTRFLLPLVMAALVIGSFSACEGPEGPAGAKGDSGADGAPGSKGDPGTVNVIYSPWKAAGTWTKTTVNGLEKYYIDIPAPGVSESVVNQGHVQVYVRLQTDQQNVYGLPYTNKSTFTEELLTSSFKLGTVRVWSYAVVPPVVPSPTNEFRYIIIPGGQAGRVNTEALSYDQVKALYNLQD
jgi:hypothetical protein